MRRIALLWLGLLVAAAPVLAAEEPAPLPGQPGGDPRPDTDEALAQLRKGRYEDAISAARRALQRDERYVPALIAMAKAYYKLKKYELAGSIVGLAQDLDPNHAESYVVLGFIALDQDDIGQATANLKRATELKPDDGNTWNTLAALYLQAKNYDAALAAAEQATRLLPRYVKAWLNLGSAQRGKAMYAEAEASYRKALELERDYADAYFNLGILHLDAPEMAGLDLTGKLGKAIDYLSRYKNVASFRLAKDDPVDSYIEEARKSIERERKRLERMQKQKERDAAKKPKPADASGTAVPPGKP